MIDIFDPIGRQVFDYKGTSYSGLNRINISEQIVQSGIYFYKVYVDGEIIGTGKFIK